MNDLHFSLRAGEVLGVAGIEGNGQKEAMEILTGNLAAESGSIRYRGNELIGMNITDNRKAGISNIP